MKINKGKFQVIQMDFCNTSGREFDDSNFVVFFPMKLLIRIVNGIKFNINTYDFD